MVTEKKNQKQIKKSKKKIVKVYEKMPSVTEMEFGELTRESRILIVTLIASVAMLSFAVFTNDFGILANSILLSTFIIAVPRFLMIYEKYMNIKGMEEKFPVFLRDVIENLSSGMPMHTSIISVSDFDYGKLSPEVKKISNQLTWNIPLENVLNQFANRMKESKRLFTSIRIIRESYISGGDVVLTLNTVAENSNILEETDKERKSMLSQYVILMYAISIVFIGIVVAINKLMIPIFEMSSATAGGSISGGVAVGISNPCDSVNLGIMGTICDLYKGTAYRMFSIEPSRISAYYVSLFFYMSMIQSIFSGLVAGQIGENSIRAGIKHSLIMVSITFGAFYLLIYFGLMGV